MTTTCQDTCPKVDKHFYIIRRYNICIHIHHVVVNLKKGMIQNACLYARFDKKQNSSNITKFLTI
jgi:hypothetical protein